MRLRLQLLVGLVVAAIFVVVAAQTPAVSVSRADAVEQLAPLIDEFQVSLSGAQRYAVVSNCLRIQATTLDPDRNRLPELETKYQTFIASTGGQIWGLTNQLEAFADDGSNLNLAMVELRRYRLDIDDQVAAYDQSLEIAVAIDCVAYPNHFVAGLYQIQADYQSLTTTISGLVGFIDQGLPVALLATECHLFGAEDQTCHDLNPRNH